MSVVNITIKERISSVPAGVVLVCNNPTDTILFEFDEEWDAHELKTARFSWGNKFIDVPFPDKEVKVPEITNTQYVFVGVYANGIASTPIKLDCKRSILCLGEHEYVPPEHTYWDEFGETLAALNKAAEDMNAAAQRAEEAAGAANTATESANKAAEDANGNAALANVAAEAANEAAASIFDKAHAIVCNAEGEMITLTDSSDDPMRGLVLFGKTTYDGTPSPENPVTLVNKGDKGNIEVTVCGKNIIKRIEVGTNVTFDGNVITFAALGDAYFLITPYCDIPDKTTVTLSFYANDFSGVFTLAPYNDRKKTQNVVPNSRNVLTFTYQQGEVILIDDVNRDVENVTLYNVQLEIGGVATNYEAPKHQSLTALTPNGLPSKPLGTTIPDVVKAKPSLMAGVWWNEKEKQYYISDTIDFERGVYVKRVKPLEFTGTENWIKSTNVNGYTLGWITDVSIDDYMARTSYICNRYASAIYRTYGEQPDHVFYAYKGATGNTIAIKDESVATLDAWKAQLADWHASGSPMQAIMMLATPIETPLSAEEIDAYRALHANYPNTTIYNDEGAEMEVQYVADTKLYIDNKFTELRNALIATGGNV